jgi:hypothetical protein
MWAIGATLAKREIDSLEPGTPAKTKPDRTPALALSDARLAAMPIISQSELEPIELKANKRNVSRSSP